MICTRVCFYQPGNEAAIALERHAGRQNRHWVNPMDRYLLKYGLLGMDLRQRTPASGTGFGEFKQRAGAEAPSLKEQTLWRTPGILKSFALHLDSRSATVLRIRQPRPRFWLAWNRKPSSSAQ